MADDFAMVDGYPMRAVTKAKTDRAARAATLRRMALELNRESRYYQWPMNIKEAAERVVALYAGAEALEATPETEQQ